MIAWVVWNFRRLSGANCTYLIILTIVSEDILTLNAASRVSLIWIKSNAASRAFLIRIKGNNGGFTGISHKIKRDASSQVFRGEVGHVSWGCLRENTRVLCVLSVS